MGRFWLKVVTFFCFNRFCDWKPVVPPLVMPLLTLVCAWKVWKALLLPVPDEPVPVVPVDPSLAPVFLLTPPRLLPP